MKNYFASLAKNFTPLPTRPDSAFIEWSKEIRSQLQPVMIFQAGPGNKQYYRPFPKDPKGKKAIRAAKRAKVRLMKAN